MTKVNYVWDGEKIKQTFAAEEKKHKPKDILDALDNIRNQINQVKDSKVKLEQQMKQAETNITNLKKSEKDLVVFEEKCIKIQKEKLLLYIKQLSPECIEKAKKDATETIAKDPNAYTEQQKENMLYVNYQKLLATNEKIATNISKNIWIKDIYDEPVYDNPFKD